MRIEAARVTLDAVVHSAPSLTHAWRAWKVISADLDHDVGPDDQEWMTKRMFELFAVYSQATMFVTGRQRVAAQLIGTPPSDAGDIADDESDKKCA